MRHTIGLGAAVLWALLCVRWFDVAAGWRPGWLSVLPVPLLAIPALAAAVAWVRARAAALQGPVHAAPHLGLAVAAAALLFRLPMAMQAAAGFITADGALSGIVMLRLLHGGEHFVFVPQVPYSGSLKSHLAALLALSLDPARAFALASVIFYAAFVAAVYRLGLELEAERDPAPRCRLALAAALFATFAPVFVTRYSLSNDGNYVEVLAFGTWALALAVVWSRDASRRLLLAPVIGLLLGLGFWSHILVVVHVAAIGLLLLAASWRDALRSSPSLVAGFVLGDLPGLLWNAANRWESFRYFLPAGAKVGDLAEGPGLATRVLGIVTDHAPVLMGYDPGNAPLLDLLLRLLAWTSIAAAVLGLCSIARALPGPAHTARALVALVGANLVIAAVALPYIPGNPRYLLFLIAPLAMAVALALHAGRGRVLLGVLLGANVLVSLVHAQGAMRADAQWRGLAQGLEDRGIRACTTDFFIATKVSFLSSERVICSAKLGPTHTEYFFEYRAIVERAPRVALVAVNATAAEKLERRLERLGVGYDRFELMKPVIVPRGRSVDPSEIFPGRDFPLR